MVKSTTWHNMDGSPIVVTENVVEYRKAITEYVRADDTVLEVGCAEGLTTALIAQTAKHAIGIDKSPSQAAKAVSRHEHVANLTFRQLDGWDISSVMNMAREQGVDKFTVIFIDVSGSRKVGDVESLLAKYEQVFNPRVFVVKAYQLKRLVMRCRLFTVQHASHQTAAGPAYSEAEYAAQAAATGCDTADTAATIAAADAPSKYSIGVDRVHDSEYAAVHAAQAVQSL